MGYPEPIPELNESEWKELEKKLNEFSLTKEQIEFYRNAKRINGKDNKGKQLAEAHWEYIEKLMKQHGEEQTTIDLIGFHYKTAMIHGYKHGKEDVKK